MQKDCREQSLPCRSPTVELKAALAHSTVLAFKIFLGALRRAERRPRRRSARRGARGVKRIQAKVQWTFAPLSGLATDGEPWACKRKQGKRSAASRTSTRRDRDCPFEGPAETTEAVRVPVRVKARARMLLGTFGETKVPRPPGRDPAILRLSKIEAGTKQDSAAVVAIQTEAEIVF